LRRRKWTGAGRSLACRVCGIGLRRKGNQSALVAWCSWQRHTSKASAHGGRVLAGAAEGLDLEGSALDFTYIELGVGAALRGALLGAAGHALGVLGHRVLGGEVGVDAGEELWGRVVLAETGHVVGDGGVCVGQVRVEWLLGLDLAVILGGVVGTVVGVVEACGRGGELAEAAYSHAAGAECNAWYRHDCGCVG
jgi:hypothetical protein